MPLLSVAVECILKTEDTGTRMNYNIISCKVYRYILLFFLTILLFEGRRNKRTKKSSEWKREREGETVEIFGLHKHRAIRDEKKKEWDISNTQDNKSKSKQAKELCVQMGGSDDEDKRRVNRWCLMCIRNTTTTRLSINIEMKIHLADMSVDDTALSCSYIHTFRKNLHKKYDNCSVTKARSWFSIYIFVCQVKYK